MPPARRKGRTSGVAKTEAAPEATPKAEATPETEVTPEAEVAPEDIDITEDLESALAMEEDSSNVSNDDKSEDIVEADTAEVDKKEDKSDDIIIEQEIIREEEMDDVEDSEAEEEVLIEELMKEGDKQEETESSITQETVDETKKVQIEVIKTKISDVKEKVAEVKKASVDSEPKAKQSEKKFKVNKIVVDPEDSDLEFQVKEDDLFENDETPINELLKCSICENVCARGVSTKCCQAIACRLCATKKITGMKQCWNCKASIKTEELVNNEDLRKAVALFKTEKEIPDDLIQKIKDMKHPQGSKSTKKDKVKSETAVKAKSEGPEKKIKPKPKYYKLEKHELVNMENGFENTNTKVYVSIQGTRFRIDQKFQSYIVQIGLLNSKSGESKLIAIKPAQHYKDDLELQSLLHMVKKSSNIFEIEPKEGEKLDCCIHDNAAEAAFLNFVKNAKAKSDSKKVDLVFFSNAEHHEVFRCYGPKLKEIVNNVNTFEDVGNKKELKPLDGDDWMADKWVLQLRKLFSDIKIAEVKEKKFRNIVSLPITKTSEVVLLISPIHTDLEKYTTFKQCVVKADPLKKQLTSEKRKTTDTKSSDIWAKKPKIEAKDVKKVGDLRNKLVVKNKINNQPRGNDIKQSRDNDIKQSKGNDTRQSRGKDSRQNDNRQSRVNESYNRRQNTRNDRRWASNDRNMDPWAKGNQSDINFGYSGNQRQVNSMYNRESQVSSMHNREGQMNNMKKNIPSLFDVRPSVNPQRSNQMMGNNGQRFNNDMGMNGRKTDERALSAELMHKQLALQQEAQRIEKLKLELELEKIRMERAKLSGKQRALSPDQIRGQTGSARNLMMGSIANFSDDRKGTIPSSRFDNTVSKYQDQLSSRYPDQSSSRYQDEPSSRYPDQLSSRYPDQSSSRYQDEPSSRYLDQSSGRYPDQSSSRYPDQPSGRYPDQLANQMVGRQAGTNQLPNLINNPNVIRMNSLLNTPINSLLSNPINSLMNTPMHEQKYNTPMGRRNNDFWN